MGEPCHVKVSSFDLSKAMTFSKIFNKVKLSPSARLVLRCLVDFYNPLKGLVYPGQDFISASTGASLRSVKSSVEELRQAGLILTVKKGLKLNYYFSRKFFELLGIAPAECKNNTKQSAEIAPTCHEQHEKEQRKNIVSFKSEFQEKYADILSKFSEYDLKKYKALKGYEKEEYLKAKKKELFQAQSSKEIQANIADNKKNTGSPLDFNKGQAIEYLNNLPAFLNDSYFARELRKKWSL